MGRAPCCDKANVKKGPWSPEEDSKLKDYIEKYGTGGNWIALPQKAGLKRCGKSCRLRWLNYLRPNIKHGEFSEDEDRIICSLYANIGSRWSIIAAQLPGRTDNDIKNYWNTKLKKKFMGFVPSPQRKPPQAQPHFPSASSPYHLTIPNRYFTGYEAMSSLPSSFQPPNASIFQPHDSFLGSTQPAYYPVKDSLLFMLGGGEPSCSSSDGSCSQMKEMEYDQQHDLGNFYYNGVEQNNKFMDGWNCTNTSDHDALCGETPVEFGVEEIKQDIGTTNLLVDENKRHEKVMYF